jgi:hypothetical protein
MMDTDRGIFRTDRESIAVISDRRFTTLRCPSKGSGERSDTVEQRACITASIQAHA